MQPAVFLDRDNTLIFNDGDLGQPDQVRLIDGVASGLRTLRDTGFNLVVVTNQAGVARGAFSEEDVDAVHQRIARLVDQQSKSAGVIDRFYYCPYHPEGVVAEYRRDHLWRKPHPGMILQAARDMGIDLSRSWMIGDQERDVLAGRAAGCQTVLVSKDAELARRSSPTAVAGDFAAAVEIVIEQSKRGGMGPGLIAGANPNGQSHAPAAPASGGAVAKPDHHGDSAGLRRALSELAEEIRSDRMHRADFTLTRMLAGICQLVALTLALLGLLQMTNADVFMKWMIGAGLVQLLTITILVLDLKG